MPVKPDLWEIKVFPGLHSNLLLHVDNFNLGYLSQGTWIFGGTGEKMNDTIRMVEAKKTNKLV